MCITHWWFQLAYSRWYGWCLYRHCTFASDSVNLNKYAMEFVILFFPNNYQFEPVNASLHFGVGSYRLTVSLPGVCKGFVAGGGCWAPGPLVVLESPESIASWIAAGSRRRYRARKGRRGAGV